MAERLTHLMSVQNCKNDGFLSAPTEKRGNRRVVYHAICIIWHKKQHQNFPLGCIQVYGLGQRAI